MRQIIITKKQEITDDVPGEVIYRVELTDNITFTSFGRSIYGITREEMKSLRDQLNKLDL